MIRVRAKTRVSVQIISCNIILVSVKGSCREEEICFFSAWLCSKELFCQSSLLHRLHLHHIPDSYVHNGKDQSATSLEVVVQFRVF